MHNRRSFLAGLFALGLCPSVTWADAGSPAFLSAARNPDGKYALFGLSDKGGIIFEIPLPGRGHAAAAHPQRPEAVAFARRPGNFALVIDCISGKTRAVLDAPSGRHFYGHGAFSADGTRLFTSENDFENAQGIIGVWAVGETYQRLGEFHSGAIGPHELKLLPDGKHLVIANGGIETHPDSGRTKLNIATMQPSLAYVRLDGTQVDELILPQTMHKNSIRHLSVGSDGTVAFAMQWQGDINQSPALLGLHTMGGTSQLLKAPTDAHRALQGYIGSVALLSGQNRLAATSPRGGMMQIFDTGSGDYVETILEPDVCGVAIHDAQFVRTSGQGVVSCSQLREQDKRQADGSAQNWRQTHICQWDNHLVPIG
ncbi:DUF1513 domain-containing protein [Cohaesibacter celericrescens]|nr:DUF1513 domain-containing protein [Cohaesibacter celericrescens]